MTSATAGGSTVAIRSPKHAFTFADLDGDAGRFREQLPPGGVAALCTDDAAVVAAAIWALEGWADEVHLLPGGVTPLVDATQVEVQPAGPVTGRRLEEHRDGAPTRWVLYTSGTTGEPKPISHTRASLARTVRAGGPEFVWGLLYDPNRMAGIQVLLQGLTTGATVVAPSIHDPIAARVQHLIESGVTALSATPSLWRLILQLPASAGWSLEQITLGGEIADQRILDGLRSAFPAARIVHVFASTETGAAFSVGDGRAGFPVAYLSDPPRGIRMEIRDDILHVHSPGVSAAGADGFASTGDVVEVVDDRVIFRGRASGVVNVGGSNVWPEAVEDILRRHPDVVDAVVSSTPNPMTGNVLVATVTMTPQADRTDATKRLRKWVRDQAPRTHVPASVTVVDRLDISAAGKVVR